VPAAHEAEPVLKSGPLVHQEIRIPADVAKSFVDELM
jgi:2-oxoglutarate ferredoxin oxidoreductase subunit beta